MPVYPALYMDLYIYMVMAALAVVSTIWLYLILAQWL